MRIYEYKNTRSRDDINNSCVIHRNIKGHSMHWQDIEFVYWESDLKQ